MEGLTAWIIDSAPEATCGAEGDTVAADGPWRSSLGDGATTLFGVWLGAGGGNCIAAVGLACATGAMARAPASPRLAILTAALSAGTLAGMAGAQPTASASAIPTIQTARYPITVYLN